MKEAAITQSPYVYVPKKAMTEQEKEDLYRTRIDETYRAYTVIDVLTKVYRRAFADDLLSYVGEHPEDFCRMGEGWNLSRAWINELKVVRPESVFFQYADDFKVDIVVQGRMKVEEVKKGFTVLHSRNTVAFDLRLRYAFDFRPCEMTCRFEKAVLKEEESLKAQDVSGLAVDKYLIPVMSDREYRTVAAWIRLNHYADACFENKPIDPARWINNLKLKIKNGSFPENGAMGEYFFGFGTADLIDKESGEVRRENINPGTIILNPVMTNTRGTLNSTLAHEGTHAYLGRFFFLLQMTHGHDYCSYMCKKYSDSTANEYHSPLERMEIQANILPRYLMIPEGYGSEYAEKLLQSYGGERSLANMKRLVDDMAEFYGTTKTMAKSRLMDFGYNEVRGILRTANGKLVPAYYSTLSQNEVYCVNETDALQEYIRNPEFRKIINSRRYRYVRESGCYCLNDPRYLFFDHEGFPHLRSYAREHMAECCLVFKEEYDNLAVRLINGILQKGTGRGRKQIRYVGLNGESPVTPEGLKLRRDLERQMAEKAVVEKSFNEMTVSLMDKKHISVGKLAELTGLSDDTIKNMRNKADIMFPIREVVAVCIALNLSPLVSDPYIESCPTKFLDSVEYRAYEYALKEWYLDPVPVVNRRLVEAGLEPLTKLVDGFDENGVRIAN